MSRHWSLVIGHSSFLLVWFLVLGSWLFAAEISKPLSPADAQKAFVLADASLKIELAASEPEVIDPVAIRFDEDGRMWVVEMRDYPLGNPDKNGPPLSKIRVLEDKDNDGRFESSTTFAEKLLFVTGLQPWKGGVFVTLSGRLAYMKDTDGDGKCDLDETWYEGFAELNTQLRANHPRLALDNWIYVANGLRGGKVINKKLNETEPINISGMDFRFDPLTGKCEAVTGNGQFGLCFDDWGNRFNVSNRNPVRHVVIEDRYLKANPNVTVPATVNDVAAFGEQSHIFPISRAWTTSNLHAGQFTAACGVYVYRGDLLPAEFKGNAFTCDPTGNLIHREIMQPAGPTFTSKAAYEGKEFLASPDEWFRPVNMELGPDGALYVVDMYRCVIEHPDFVPDELKRRPDLRLGDDRGRIWRIVPKVGRSGPDRPVSRTKPALSKTSADQLISLLSHSNAWQRETAQRLFLERSAGSSANELREVVKKSESPLGRSHALWVLTGAEALERDDVRIALRDSDPLVRRQSLLAAELSGRAKALAGVVSDLTRDSSSLVRFQSRLTARIIGASQLLEPKQLISDANNPWMRRAIELSVEPRTAAAILAKVWFDTNDSRDVSAGELSLIEGLSEMAAAVDAQRLGSGIGVSELSEKDNVDVGLAALRGAAKVWARKNVPDSLRPSLVPADRLLEIANNKNSDSKDRASAVALLGFAPDAAGHLLPFTEKTRDQSIRIAAIGALARQKGTDAWQPLLDQFASDTPPIRRAILDGLLSNKDRTKLLLDAIEAGRVKSSEIDQLQVKRLTENRDAAIKDRAAKLFAAAMPADRAKALADYQPVLQMKGDPGKGQVVFEKNCAACHRINGIGVNVAPDISDSRAKKYEQILADILQPNRAIDNNYVGYTVRQLDGTILTGILAAETATSITLKQQGGKEAVIPRSEIDELKSSGQSLMPEGLERQIPPPDMADLLAFIKNWRYLDGRTPLSDSGQ
jgi:putative membrane-bound dehydrogenase-like protein